MSKGGAESRIQNLPDSKSAAIIDMLLSMAKRLNLEVVAEGIEEISQLEHLKATNCHFGQGYLFAKPLTHEQCSALLGQTLLPDTELSLN